ncbi:MAG TPA: hypothetical protein VF846_10565 [Thermoanaerobaculia bacterium]|jgi:hypothetical protein
MPVWKYKHIGDMPEAWTVNRHMPLGGRIRAMLSMTPIAGSLNMPRGVSKFRSLDDLAADRARYERARIHRIRERNASK